MSFYTGENSSDFYPAMPVIDIEVQRETDEESVGLTAIVDSGADNTMIPIAFLEHLEVKKARTAWMV